MFQTGLRARLVAGAPGRCPKGGRYEDPPQGHPGLRDDVVVQPRHLFPDAQ